MSAVIAIAAFAVVYLLLVSERVERVVAALAGAAIVLLFGVVSAHDVFFSADTGIDWNVIALLFAMMVIVGGLRRTGLFDFLAIWAVKRAAGSGYRVFVLLATITAVSALFLSDVATVVLLAPVTLIVCDRLGMKPVPLLVASALAANIGGSMSLVGDPANIIVGSRASLSFNDVLTHQGPVVVVIFVVFLVVGRFLFRDALAVDPARVVQAMAMSEREAIADVRLLSRALIVLALVIVGFLFQDLLDTQASVVALLGAGAMWAVTQGDRHTLLDHVEWETLAFLMGLFIVVGALVKVGAIDHLATFVGDLIGGDPTRAVLGTLGGSAVISALVDNIPYVATMSPAVARLSTTNPALNPGDGLWYALALGSILGGNATAIGASANVVVIGIAKRHGYPISFWEFTRYGAVIAVISLLVAMPYFWLVYLA